MREIKKMKEDQTNMLREITELKQMTSKGAVRNLTEYDDLVKQINTSRYTLAR